MADDDATNPEDLQLEKENFLRVVTAFKNYRSHALKRVASAEKHFKDIPESHKKMLPDFLSNLNTIRKCIDQNCHIINMIIQDSDRMFENRSNGIVSSEEMETMGQQPLGAYDMDKVKTTLKQFVRDWSEAGQAERDACYAPVIAAVQERFPPGKCPTEMVNILVPGAGLGRLTYDLASQGYCCQGNEWSLYMLLSSNFVLNKCHEVNSCTLYPWLHQWTNNLAAEDQTAAVTFPDVSPALLPAHAQLSMAAGDFLEVYTEESAWDCITSVFFIDTAHNIIDYIERFYHILKPGGLWVNLGPLLYHYADMASESSVELSYADVKRIIQEVGFVIEREETDMKTQYAQNPKSMLQYTYHSVFFTATKPSS